MASHTGRMDSALIRSLEINPRDSIFEPIYTSAGNQAPEIISPGFVRLARMPLNNLHASTFLYSSPRESLPLVDVAFSDTSTPSEANRRSATRRPDTPIPGHESVSISLHDLNIRLGQDEDVYHHSAETQTFSVTSYEIDSSLGTSLSQASLDPLEDSTSFFSLTSVSSSDAFETSASCPSPSLTNVDSEVNAFQLNGQSIPGGSLNSLLLLANAIQYPSSPIVARSAAFSPSSFAATAPQTQSQSPTPQPVRNVERSSSVLQHRAEALARLVQRRSRSDTTSFLSMSSDNTEHLSYADEVPNHTQALPLAIQTAHALEYQRQRDEQAQAARRSRLVTRTGSADTLVTSNLEDDDGTTTFTSFSSNASTSIESDPSWWQGDEAGTFASMPRERAATTTAFDPLTPISDLLSLIHQQHQQQQHPPALASLPSITFSEHNSSVLTLSTTTTDRMSVFSFNAESSSQSAIVPETVTAEAEEDGAGGIAACQVRHSLTAALGPHPCEWERVAAGAGSGRGSLAGSHSSNFMVGVCGVTKAWTGVGRRFRRMTKRARSGVRRAFKA